MLANTYVKTLSIMDNRIAAWKTSRPDFDFSNFHIDDVGFMDISLNSMKMYTLEIKSSIFMRDLIFSLRPIHPWAQSLRSRPMKKENLLISHEYGIDEEYERSINYAIFLLNNGEQQDSIREHLPMALSTTYTVVIDLRTLIGFMKMIDQIPFLKDEYLHKFIHAIGDNEFKNSKIGSFKDTYCLSEIEKNTSAGSAGNITYGSLPMKSSLMSQFIRKHNSIVKTELWNYAFNGIFKFYQFDIFQVAFYIETNQYKRMIQIRSHWFADWANDMWGQIVGEYVSSMTTEEFWNFIPNGNGKEDPFFGDTISRITGEENSIPCPIMCECPQLVALRLKQFGPNPVINKYIDLVNEGYIPDNPQNKYRLQYEGLK